MSFDGRPTIYEESERQLFRLIYASRPAAQIAPRRAAALGEILASAFRNNPRYEVTGVLLVNEDWFLQLLEGPRAGVRAIYRRIERDPRHEGVQTLSAEVADERLFPLWSMSARVLADVDPRVLERLGRPFDPFSESVGAVLKVLTAAGEAYQNRQFAEVQALRARLTAA